jgi:hypothetical protein
MWSPLAAQGQSAVPGSPVSRPCRSSAAGHRGRGRFATSLRPSSTCRQATQAEPGAARRSPLQPSPSGLDWNHAVGDRRFGVPVRIQYAAAFSRGVSYGVAPYSGRRIELADPEPGLLSTPHKGFANHLLQIIQPLAGLLPRAHSVIRSVRISSSVSGYCEVGSTTLVISLDLPVRYSVRPAKTYIYLAGRSPGHRPQEPALHGLDRMQKRPVSLKKG